MYIREILDRLRSGHLDGMNPELKERCAKSGRDVILFGENVERECTGIVVTCWASYEVIERAIELGANLIICHEALFWNHGDNVDWLTQEGNPVYFRKRDLLERGEITVWRDHDYMHACTPIGEGRYGDGIYYGLASQLGWLDNCYSFMGKPTMFEFRAQPFSEFLNGLLAKLNLNGARIIGSRDVTVRRVYLCEHVMGKRDNAIITTMESEDIDVAIPLELIDSTLTAYVRDSAFSGRPRAIVSLGHFNTEEPGMQWLTTWIRSMLNGAVACTFIQSGDMFHYALRQH